MNDCKLDPTNDQPNHEVSTPPRNAKMRKIVERPAVNIQFIHWLEIIFTVLSGTFPAT